MTRDCRGAGRWTTTLCTYYCGICAILSRYRDARTASCRVNASRETRSSRTCLPLLNDIVDLVALDVVHIPFPIDCPIEVASAIALCTVIRPHGVVQIVPLVPGGLHFARDVVLCDIKVSTYIRKQAWKQSRRGSIPIIDIVVAVSSVVACPAKV